VFFFAQNTRPKAKEIPSKTVDQFLIQNVIMDFGIEMAPNKKGCPMSSL